MTRNHRHRHRQFMIVLAVLLPLVLVVGLLVRRPVPVMPAGTAAVDPGAPPSSVR